MNKFIKVAAVLAGLALTGAFLAGPAVAQGGGQTLTSDDGWKLGVFCDGGVLSAQLKPVDYTTANENAELRYAFDGGSQLRSLWRWDKGENMAVMKAMGTQMMEGAMFFQSLKNSNSIYVKVGGEKSTEFAIGPSRSQLAGLIDSCGR